MTDGEMAGAAVSLVAAWVAWREHLLAQRAQAAQQAAEAEVARIRLLASAPFYVPSDARFNALYVASGRQVFGIHPGDINLLCWMRDEVGDLPAGTPVYLVVENGGENPRWQVVELDGRGGVAHFAMEADMQAAQGRCFLTYPFDPAQLGHIQTLTVHFEGGGVQGVHRYALEHGRRKLARIDPPIGSPGGQKQKPGEQSRH